MRRRHVARTAAGPVIGPRQRVPDLFLQGNPFFLGSVLQDQIEGARRGTWPTTGTGWSGYRLSGRFDRPGEKLRPGTWMNELSNKPCSFLSLRWTSSCCQASLASFSQAFSFISPRPVPCPVISVAGAVVWQNKEGQTPEPGVVPSRGIPGRNHCKGDPDSVKLRRERG